MTTLPKTHTPLLINFAAMHRAYPKRYTYPGREAVELVGLNTLVKIQLAQELRIMSLSGNGIVQKFKQPVAFWLEVCAISRDYWTGVVKSAIIHPEIRKGDLVRFVPENIVEINNGKD